jgi:hypothetical protein
MPSSQEDRAEPGHVVPFVSSLLPLGLIWDCLSQEQVLLFTTGLVPVTLVAYTFPGKPDVSGRRDLLISAGSSSHNHTPVTLTLVPLDHPNVRRDLEHSAKWHQVKNMETHAGTASSQNKLPLSHP